MTFRFACPSCAVEGVANTSFVGRSVRCRQCHHRFTIPPPGATSTDVYGLEVAPSSTDVTPEPDGADGSVFVTARGDSSGPAPLPRRTPRIVPKRAERAAERDGKGGRGYVWPVRVVVGLVLTLAAIALWAPRGPIIVASVLLALGSLMVLIGYAAGAHGAFREDFLHGFLYVAVPFYTAYYLITRWDDLWPWFACSTAGFLLVTLGTEILRWSGAAV